jgi:uncharacterized protein (UPF0332 family)
MKIDYFKEGLLKRVEVNEKEIKGSLEIAEKFIKRAEGNLKIKYFDVAFILAYNSMFHTARALLFSLGVKERSHFAMINYLKEKFQNNEKILRFLEILDSYRITRHAIQYSGEFCSKIDAEEALKDAKKFLDVTKKSIKLH